MKAAVLHGVDQAIQIENVPDPTPEPGQAVVRLRAAALNHRDVWIRKGQYAGLKFPIILGSDGVGTVESAEGGWEGKDVILNPSLGWGENESHQNGETFSILGLPHDGTFAQKVKVPIENLVEKPSHMSDEEAASLPLAGLTAYRALLSRAGLHMTNTVLVTGAGGGAASFAVQIASAFGARVFVTSGSEEKIDRARAMGAEGGANYREEGWAAKLKEMADGFDVIVDSAGGTGFADLIDLAHPGGRIVFFGATAGNPPGFDMRKVFWKQLSILGTTMGSPNDFEAMVRFFADHRLAPNVDTVMPLEEANDALNRMERGEQHGKIVLRIE